MIKNLLLAAAAAAIVATGAGAASADDDRYYNDGYYYDNGRSWQYEYRNGYDEGYGNPDIVSPRSIVRSLERSDFTYISRPVLSGRFYQVKAIDPNGRKVKLYIDAFSGEIVKVKS